MTETNEPTPNSTDAILTSMLHAAVTSSNGCCKDGNDECKDEAGECTTEPCTNDPETCDKPADECCGGNATAEAPVVDCQGKDPAECCPDAVNPTNTSTDS